MNAPHNCPGACKNGREPCNCGQHMPHFAGEAVSHYVMTDDELAEAAGEGTATLGEALLTMLVVGGLTALLAWIAVQVLV